MHGPEGKSFTLVMLALHYYDVEMDIMLRDILDRRIYQKTTEYDNFLGKQSLSTSIEHRTMFTCRMKIIIREKTPFSFDNLNIVVEEKRDRLTRTTAAASQTTVYCAAAAARTTVYCAT
ncbi:hypothetical protein ACJX0J_027499, partial [Zea mays]